MYTLERTTLIKAPLDEVFEFFSDIGRLRDITPAYVGLRDLTQGERQMHVGMRVVHGIRWFGLTLKWSTSIKEYEPPHRFVDEQVSGPYHAWRHEHTFEERDGQTLMTDRVQYELPFGILGKVAHSLLVSRQLRDIFDYRGRKIRKIFGERQVAVI